MAGTRVPVIDASGHPRPLLAELRLLPLARPDVPASCHAHRPPVIRMSSGRSLASPEQTTQELRPLERAQDRNGIRLAASAWRRLLPLFLATSRNAQIAVGGGERGPLAMRTDTRPRGILDVVSYPANGRGRCK
jgi:hypothetical protein